MTFTPAAALNAVLLGYQAVTGPGTATVANVNNIIKAVLAGGSLSGTGSVGTIPAGLAISGPSTGAVTTVNPGANGSGIGMGILQTTGDVTWGASTKFNVDLGDASNTHPAPLPGADYDQLDVNGNVTLGSGNAGALLSGTYGSNIQIGDTFTILQATGTITGNFTEMINGVQTGIGVGAGFATDSFFIGGYKFTVQYNTHSVVLTRALINSTLTIAPTTNPMYGLDPGYTATITPELGARCLPPPASPPPSPSRWTALGRIRRRLPSTPAGRPAPSRRRFRMACG